MTTLIDLPDEPIRYELSSDQEGAAVASDTITLRITVGDSYVLDIGMNRLGVNEFIGALDETANRDGGTRAGRF
jgi:hypothetical protein